MSFLSLFTCERLFDVVVLLGDNNFSLPYSPCIFVVIFHLPNILIIREICIHLYIIK